MKKDVDLGAILNVKKAYDKKVDTLRKSLEKSRFLLRKLEAISLNSSEKEAQAVFMRVARFSKEKHLIVAALGAEKLFSQLKSLLAELVNDFSKQVDEIVDQLMIFHLQERTDDHKILRQMFDLVFSTAQFNAIHYRVLYHPQFLRVN
jgi:hypothetical protein